MVTVASIWAIGAETSAAEPQAEPASLNTTVVRLVSEVRLRAKALENSSHAQQFPVVHFCLQDRAP